jgi:hypothetical protein
MAAPATYTENLTINTSLRIVGSDATTTIIDGGGVNAVITNNAADALLSKLTIRNGNATWGGGIDNNGTLTVTNTTISGNSAGYGGGIYDSGTLTITNSTITGNSAIGEGGGIENFGTLTIQRSTITANNAPNGSGINIVVGAVAITNSTISGNSGTWGGGIDNDLGGTATITNSTISGNSVSSMGGGIFNYGVLTINNVTISGNSAAAGVGGIWSGKDDCCAREAVEHGEVGGIRQVPADSGSAIFQNSIVSHNSGGNCAAQYGGTITSNGYNLSGDNSCKFSGIGDMNGTNPMLGKLGSYGGLTETIFLRSGSPAIDAGNPNGCTDGKGNLLTTDQRGYPRPGRGDTGRCDMGAFERQN